MVHPMARPLTPEDFQHHTAVIRVSRIASHLSDLVSSVQDIEDISLSAQASLHDVAQNFAMAHDRHNGRVGRISTLESPTSYKVFNMGRAAASSTQRSLFYAHEALLIHQQALRVQVDRVEGLMRMLKRSHKFTKTSAYLMEEAVDLSTDLYTTSARSQQAATSEALNDYPGTDDEFEDKSDSSDAFTAGLGLDGNETASRT
jgi:DNA anti-recombination protein RmuC